MLKFSVFLRALVFQFHLIILLDIRFIFNGMIEEFSIKKLSTTQ